MPNSPTNYARKAARLVKQAETHFARAHQLQQLVNHERKLARSLIRSAELACPNTMKLAVKLAEMDQKAAKRQDERIPDDDDSLAVTPIAPHHVW